MQGMFIIYLSTIKLKSEENICIITTVLDSSLHKNYLSRAAYFPRRVITHHYMILI